MTKILNLGSLNIDYVYFVDNFVKPGETMSSITLSKFAGGKGLNQSIALANAGAKVFHVGKTGKEAKFLINTLKKSSVNCSFIELSNDESGHAIIQVNKKGENCIIIHGGTNKTINIKLLKMAFANFAEGDFFLTQNETNLISEAFNIAKKKKMKIVFNPAPITKDIKKYPLDMVDILILNESELEKLFGKIQNFKKLIDIRKKFNFETIILTLGAKGAVICEQNNLHFEPAVKVKTVDTTAAGDTFVGFFIAQKMQGKNSLEAVKIAVKASAICVQKKGASNSIPKLKEVILS
ncbi:MAG TPA: ribokinase [Victivallales bacterium]|mgnify:CR=1 FL=1|nr:ribokinase [Victivallales bacterium]HRR06006.1 ribokinase [Victivallales bacterium]HRR29169.1 ribokinase [Victivallales bacterium]HRU00979.1 ribokinase [Victivallales bacterium]